MFSGRWWNLWGHRYSPNGGYGGFAYDDMGMDGGEVIYDGPVSEGNAVPSTPKSQTPTPAARQTQSAIKKTGARQPYYEQPPERPMTTTRSAPGFRAAPSYRAAPNTRTASRPQYDSPEGRYVR